MNIQKSAQKGFTLIELMIVIAIVGILAAIALPAYQDYTVRAKMSEPLAMLAEAKTTITEYYVSNRGVPATQAVSGVVLTRDSAIVETVTYADVGGLPLLTVAIKQSELPGATADGTFVLSGSTTSDGTLAWKCKPAGANAVEAKYLPANCRG